MSVGSSRMKHSSACHAETNEFTVFGKLYRTAVSLRIHRYTRPPFKLLHVPHAGVTRNAAVS